MIKTKKTRIAIAGIGGIGGYIGGKLAHHYFNSESIEIIFIARGEVAEAINKNGLYLNSNDISYTCVPTITSEDPKEIGIIDILIVCTKSFSVEALFKKYDKILSPDVTVITTQNTVNGKETITPFLPVGATLMEGSIYIASNIIEPGRIKHISGPSKFFFGLDNENNSKGHETAKILNDAGVDTTYATNIKSVLWKKFMFISPAAIVAAIFQISFSEILGSTKYEILYINLITELMQLAKAKKIDFDGKTVINNMNLLSNFKGKIKASFQLDLEGNKPSEINTLVKYVINESKRYHLLTPFYENSFNDLNKKYSLNQM